jgi:hypothetical protein
LLVLSARFGLAGKDSKGSIWRVPRAIGERPVFALSCRPHGLISPREYLCRTVAPQGRNARIGSFELLGFLFRRFRMQSGYDRHRAPQWAKLHLLGKRPNYSTAAVGAMRRTFGKHLDKPSASLDLATIVRVLDGLAKDGSRNGRRDGQIRDCALWVGDPPRKPFHQSF